MARVATEVVHGTRAPASIRGLVDRDALGACVLAAAVPFLFLHERYQPDLSLAAGSATVDVRLSDLALLAVLVVTIAFALRTGIERLRAGRWLWVAGLALLAWLAFQTFRPASRGDSLFDDHLVTFAKLVEYAVLTVAVPVLVRRTADLAILVGALVLWGGVAVGVGLLQFFGVDIFGAWNAGWRQPSFLGHHDFAALSAVAIALAAAAIVARRRETPVPSLLPLALAAGVLGLVLAGSVTAAGGLAVGAAALWLAGRRRYRPSGRRTLALVAVVAVVAGGVVAVRGDTLADFVRFLGISGNERPAGVESYSQRTVLAYLGLRIFQDHPVLGVGWQRSTRFDIVEPYLADAHRRFPDVVELAFPAEGRPWGIQNLYIQMLADAGIVGFALLVAVGATGIALAWRTAARAPAPWAAGSGLLVLCALLAIAGEWASQGIVPGIPLQATSCLLLGLAAAGAATASEASG